MNSHDANVPDHVQIKYQYQSASRAFALRRFLHCLAGDTHSDVVRFLIECDTIFFSNGNALTWDPEHLNERTNRSGD